MSGILLELLPYIIGAGFAPVWIIITLLLLRGPGGAATGGAFVGGLVLVRLLQGYLASLLYSGIPNEQGERQVVASTLIIQHWLSCGVTYRWNSRVSSTIAYTHGFENTAQEP